ncbi:hypothetical protein C8Q73DRAFT_792873 [Cubamyces lactineus]|nr:hypothetical protein C8Q73DRAFT_792873 [Cubamyces lactineus]
MSIPYVQQSQPGGFPSTTQPLRRDPDLWFFDGNVVLVAQGVAAFRVHKGVLAQYSDVFKSWFTGPAPITGCGSNELCEGAQVVRLGPNDTAYDVKHGLLMVYGVRQNQGARVDFSDVMARSRFALAYDMHALADASLRLLSPIFYSALETLDTFEECSVSFNFRDCQAIEAYNVMKTRDVGFLFMAIYRCAQLPVEVLRSGTKRIDGTPEVLSEPDLQIMLKAKAQLRELSSRVLAECYKTRSSNGPECHETGCADAFSDIMFPEGPGAQELIDGDAVSRWALDRIDDLRSDERICERCARNARKRHEDLREAIWEAFVVDVDVPEGWEF